MKYLFLSYILIALLLCLAYLLTIISYCFGWLKTKTINIEADLNVYVSIIIAARNEEENIIDCLKSIEKQNYSDKRYEVIIVDDASADATNSLISQFCEKKTFFKLITLSENSGITGKKNAITAAIKIAKGELIVTTDADCVMGENWLPAMVSCYAQKQAKMIVAPVCFYNEKNVFQKMQSLEFMALMTSGGASLYYNKAIMCNGANLAFMKDVFNELNGFEGINERASGDDVLLMYKISKKYPQSICFLKNYEAIVYTKPKSTIKGFIHQRRRWASKDFSTLNTETKRVSFIVFFFNLILFSLPLIGIFFLINYSFYAPFFKICLILIGIKCFIDFLLLFLAASFFKKKRLLVYFLPEQFIYILYVVVIGLLGKAGKYEWKGRTIK